MVVKKTERTFRMSITASSFLLICICVAAILALGYLQVLPVSIGSNPIRVFVGALGILLSAATLFLHGKNNLYRRMARRLKRYVVPMALCVIFELAIASIKYRYSLWEMIIAVVPYMYVLYAFPIAYVISKRKSIMQVWKVLANIELVILVIKLLSWYLYNFTSSSLLSGIALEYNIWTRNGLQRVEQGALFGVAFVYYLHLAMSVRKNRIRNLAITVYMVFFSIVVTQFRFLTLSMVVTILFVIFYQRKAVSASVVIKRIVFVAVVGIVACVVMPKFLESFSTSGSLGGSTSARLVTLGMYTDMMIKDRGWLGLGLLDAVNANASAVMTHGWHFSYLDDLGIIGGIVRFGVLAIFVYGSWFVTVFRTCIREYKRHTSEVAFVLGLGVYVLFSCVLLNIYDAQRSFAMPFYLVAFSYYGEKRR